ncbi:MAG: YeeE/YedE family protein [Flavobacteriaceae bacterium]|nr:YeeE/YedE family protein [Flavobacteriaceae bacterium]
MDIILNPWPWYVAGPLIAFTMFLLFYFGKYFGVSSNLENICALGGAGKFVDFFKFDWRKNTWNLMFILGIILGGFITNEWLITSDTVILSPQTITDLSAIGIQNAGHNFLPSEIFSTESMLTLKGFALLIGAGFLVGFGSRYAGGCTSGHGIMGMSNLETPSFIAVGGFFIGGLIMTWFILPHIF